MSTSSWPPLTTYQEMTRYQTIQPISKSAHNMITTGSAPLSAFISAVVKCMFGHKYVYPLITENLPTIILHEDSIIESIAATEVGTGIGFGIVYDGFGQSHHATLLVRLADGSNVLINTNGNDPDNYVPFLRKYRVDYFAINIQSKISDRGDCGPTVLMLLKYLIRFSHTLTSIDQIDFTVKAYHKSASVVLLKDYHSAVSEIAEEHEKSGCGTYVSESDRCRWCAVI